MATGERRMGSSARRGMTVLGKIPAVPKPINLPSQRLENRGLDPSVEIVPRGTFSWGTGQSPPTGGSSWGNVGLPSSPPVSTGAWNTASNVQAACNPESSAGVMAQNPPRPLSAESTRPSSAPMTTRRAWGGAAKLEEQLQPSRFTLTSVDFPTLGSDKNPNLRPQQNMTSLNRPTSADGTKDRHSVYPETSSNRPTSADGTKERQSVYPGIVPSNRPTSADGTFVDKERHPVYSETSPSNRPASADGRHPVYPGLSNRPPSADGSVVDKQRHPVYMGVVGHGTAGPGSGTYGRLEDNYNLYHPLVRHGIAPPGSHGIPIRPGMYPGASYHDGYHRSRVPHYGNMEDRETIMLAMRGSQGVNSSYPPHSGPPDLYGRSGVYGRYHPQSGSPEHPGHGTVGIGPQPHGMDTMMSRERPVLGHGRDGYHGLGQEFGEQRDGWVRRDGVHLAMPIDASDNRSPISISGTGVELPNTSITSWGHQPGRRAWGSISSGDTPVGIHKAEASSSMHRPITLLEKMPQGSTLEGQSRNRYMEEIKGRGPGHAGEPINSLAPRRADYSNKEILKSEDQPKSHLDMVISRENHVAGKVATHIDTKDAAKSIDSLSKDLLYQKQEDLSFPAENLTRKAVIADFESSEKGRDRWVGRSPRGDSRPPSSVSVIGSGADKQKQATAMTPQLQRDNQGTVPGVNETKDFSRPVPEIAISPAVGSVQLLSKFADVQVPGAEVSFHQGQSASQTLKAIEEVGGSRAERSGEPPKMVPALKVAIQANKESPKGDNKDFKFSKDNNDIQIVDDDSKSGVLDAAKSMNVRKKMPVSCKSTRGTKKNGLPLSLPSESKGATGVSEESLLSSETSERNRVNTSISSCAGCSASSGEKHNSAVSSGVKVTSDAAHACSESDYTDAHSNGVSDADQVESPKHTETEASSKGDHEVPPRSINDSVVQACETVAVPSSQEEGQVYNNDGPEKKAKRKVPSLRRFQRDRSLHESHSMDKKHANEGMVWAPIRNSATVGGTKEETRLCIPKASTLEQLQQISAESNHQILAQPMQQQQEPIEIRNQRHSPQVQQLQSAASSHRQGQQMQQQSTASNKKQGHQMQQYQSAENIHKKQEQQMQQKQYGASAHQEHEQWMQQEQSTARSYRKQGRETQQQHSVASSHQEQGQQIQRQFAASSPKVQREVQIKETCIPEEQQEKAGRSIPVPVVDKSEPRKGKDENTIYIPKPARQQQQQQQQRRQQQQQWQQQQSAASSNQGQRYVHKGERSFSEDQGKQPSGTSEIPVAIGPESNKNKNEIKSYNSKYSRQQEQESSCNAGERHRHTQEMSLPEETGEQSFRTSATSLVSGSEASKDKEETKSHNSKHVRKQEMQQQQSAVGSHQEHRYVHARDRSLPEEYWKQPVQAPAIPVVIGFESSTSKDETKFYIPKHVRQQHMHQQQAVTSSHQGQKQVYNSRETHLPDEELEQSAQSSTSPVGESTKKKHEIELYTPKPARQQQMQPQQSAARSHHGQRNARERSLAEEQCQQAAAQAGTGSESSKNKDMLRHDRLSDSKGNKGTMQSCTAGSKDDSKSHVSSESSKTKKEIKYYVPKPGRRPQLQQQQSLTSIEQGQRQVPTRERPSPQEKWEIPFQTSAAAPIVTGPESSKRKDEIKLYTPKPVRQQQTQSATGGHEEEREMQTEEWSLPEEKWEQQKVGNDGSARESGRSSRYRNHPSMPHKSTSSPRLPIKSQPPLEDSPIGDAIPRASETNGRGFVKEHLKEGSCWDPGYHQKNESSQWQHDVAENPTVAEAQLSKQKQHIEVTKTAEPVSDSVRNGSPMSTKFNSTPVDSQKRRYHYQPVAQASQTFKPREHEFEVVYQGEPNTRQRDQGLNRYERCDNGPRRGRFHGYGYRAANYAG